MRNKPLMSDEEQTAIARRGFTIGNEIGKGSFGIVYRGKYFDTKIAVKKIDMKRTRCNKAAVFMEMFILEKIRHHYVVRVYDFFLVETKHLFIFMELLSGGDLGVLMKNNPLPEGKVAELYWQFGSGLAYMHRRGFAHRDLKPGNILLTEDKTGAKLADFGISMQAYDTETGEPIKTMANVGTPYYKAPEIVYTAMAGECYTFGLPKPNCPFMADIWSMGIIVFEMLHGKDRFPFVLLPYGNLLEHYQRVKSMTEYLSSRTFSRRGLSNRVKLFVMRHLKLNPDERPTMDVLLKDKWIKALITEGSQVEEQ